MEDSPRVAGVLVAGLRERTHTVAVAATLGEADHVFAEQRFDIAVVDVGLPDGSGLSWCRKVRSSGCEMPILFLTARNGVADCVAGLEAGADDYLGKPFSMDELVARIRALARRGPRWTESLRTFGPVVIDCDRRLVTVAGQKLAFTTRELDIVALLAWRDGRIAARDEILETVWGDATARAAASLEVLVARIRRKLAEHGVHDALRTVRQVGYAWAIARSKPD